ncbi:MAG: hypothetical protein WAM82_20155 [Thermoanaerobaculia bacterium]
MRRRLPAGLAITLLTFATGCGRDHGKPPAVLQATPEAIVLIRDNEARCARIGQDGVQRLATAEEEVDRALKTSRAEAYEKEEADLRTERATRALAAAEEEAELRNQKTPRGRAAAQEAAELRISQARAMAAAGAVRDEGKAPPQLSEVFKKYLAEDAEELAAADAAQDVIQGLLPQVRAEAPPEVAKAVDALSGAQDQVCLAARQPRRLAQYRGTLDFAENSYRAAEEKLLPLYAVSATDTQFALHKYGSNLAAARVASRRQNRPAAALPAKDYDRDQREWQSVQQVQSQTENEHEAALNKWYRKRDKPEEAIPRVKAVEKPPPSPEDQARAMRTWYSGYTAKVGPVKSALASYLRLRKAGTTGESLGQSCEAMMTANGSLLNDPVALEPPDAQAAKLLRAAFTEIEGLAQACRDGQTAETVFRLEAFERVLGEAAAALHAYSLAP